MSESRGNIFSFFILAAAMIICAVILKDAYLGRGYPSPSIPYINMDISQLENALKTADKDTLTVSEAAGYLGIKEEEFSSMIYAGKLDEIPYVNINSTIVFSKKALNDWLEAASKAHEWLH